MITDAELEELKDFLFPKPSPQSGQFLEVDLFDFFKKSRVIIPKLIQAYKNHKFAISQALLCLDHGDGRGLSERCVKLLREVVG